MVCQNKPYLAYSKKFLNDMEIKVHTVLRQNCREVVRDKSSNIIFKPFRRYCFSVEEPKIFREKLLENKKTKIASKMICFAKISLNSDSMCLYFSIVMHQHL